MHESLLGDRLRLAKYGLRLKGGNENDPWLGNFKLLVLPAPWKLSERIASRIHFRSSVPPGLTGIHGLRGFTGIHGIHENLLGNRPRLAKYGLRLKSG